MAKNDQKEQKAVSPSLKNIKHEKFARAVIEFNGDPKKSLEASGYKFSGSYFSQLKARPDIASRISQLIEESNDGKVAKLSERLEMLSEIARDKTQTKSIRIKALSELHSQSGDAKQVIDVNNNSIVKYTEIELPKKDTDKDTKEADLDLFIDDLDNKLCLMA